MAVKTDTVSRKDYGSTKTAVVKRLEVLEAHLAELAASVRTAKAAVVA